MHSSFKQRQTIRIKKKERNKYINNTNIQINQQINNTDRQTNRWTIHRGIACHLYRFVFVSLHVPVCASARARVHEVCIIKHY